MKKVLCIISGFFVMALGFSQTGGTDQKLTNKIVLIIGQKIIVETNITMEANLSPGMDMNTKSISATTLEVKSRTDTNYIISNTVTKVKLDMDMLGQSTSYDSDKKEDQESEFGKSFADKINKPKDFVIDMVTGKNQPLEKNDPIKNTEEINSANGLVNMFADNTDDAAVSSAFSLIPQDKKIGDKWSDSTITKDKKIVRQYTLNSITDNDATIQLDIVMDATTTFEQQGMSVEFTSTTKTKEEIITSIVNGQVKKRTSQADISGSIQVMGQSVPVTAKTITTSTYK